MNQSPERTGMMTEGEAYQENAPFYRLLATKYDQEKEIIGIQILKDHPQIATLEWPGPDKQGSPVVRGSTALHYAANDGKLNLIRELVHFGADVNACNASWYWSVFSWVANNVRVEAIRLLLNLGASANSLHCLHVAAWGGSARGHGKENEYAAALKIALESGNIGTIKYLTSIGAEATEADWTNNIPTERF